MAELVLHRDGEPLVRLPIDRDRIRLGRSTGNDVVLPDDAVSEVQALLEHRDGAWFVQDQSGTGTHVDASLVRESTELADGATLGLGGPWSAVFRLGPPTSPGEARRAAAGGTKARPAESLPSEAMRLRWIDDEGRHALPLFDEQVGIGSDPGNEVVLADGYASGLHARLTLAEGRWRIRDLDSTNGTFVGGVQISEALLLPGAVVRIGETDIAFEADVPDPDLPDHGIVTRDPALEQVLSQVSRVADSDATVTIFGESGTGKELVARYIHDAGKRVDGPFIPVNCAAISKELIESELFGHERGAFTGANTSRRGAFEEADGGTLFLDEVGELPADLQAKLLRVLELKEIRRVGASRPLKVDVRIVAATNRDLHAEVRAGRFREDLFYRLFVVPLTLPPLRRRPGDVLLLADHFVRTRALSDPPPTLTEAARSKLAGHPWPGNVRELKNTVERALLFHRGGRIEATDVTFAEPLRLPADEGVIQAAGKTLAEIEAEAIRIALKANGGNRRQTAEALGMARSTLQVKLKELGIVGGEG